MSASHINFQFNKANVRVEQMEHYHKADVNEPNQPHINTLHYGQAIPLCRVHFTLRKFNNVYNQQTHVVFITNHETGASMWPFYWQGYHPHANFVRPCYQIPPALYILKSQFICTLCGLTMSIQ